MVSDKLRIVSEKPIVAFARKEFPRIDKDETLMQAYRLMEKYNADAVIVTDDKTPIGVMGRRGIIDKLAVERTRRVTASRLHVSSFAETPLRVVSSDTRVDEASRILLAESLPALPIGEGEQVKAVFMPRDTPRITLDVDDLSVAEIVGPPKYIARYGDRVVHVRQKFIELDIVFAPVVDFEGKIRGTVSLDEIVGALIALHEEFESKHIRERINQLSVEDIMNRNVVEIEAETELGTASHVLVEKKALGAVVLDEERIIGVLTPIDILRALTTL